MTSAETFRNKIKISFPEAGWKKPVTLSYVDLTLFGIGIYGLIMLAKNWKTIGKI
jgi:hypothetical protein